MTARNGRTFSEICGLACRRSVALRGLKFSVIVGPILVAINQGDVILSGEVGPTVYLKIALTFMVPYAVSVFSSVGSILAHETANSTEA